MANPLIYYILSTILWEKISKLQLQEAAQKTAQNKALIWYMTKLSNIVFPPKITNLKTVQYIWKPLTDWKAMPFS